RLLLFKPDSTFTVGEAGNTLFQDPKERKRSAGFLIPKPDSMSTVEGGGDPLVQNPEERGSA
ncbi:UNVERIFIED_CONTAM: hypothetical protein K2H54_063002, partial [Gekko kuhli]